MARPSALLPSRPLAALALSVLLGALAGCGGSDDPGTAGRSPSAAGSSSGSSSGSAPATASSSAPASADATPGAYLPVPAGVVLTPQGTTLPVGSPATVAWQPRQDTTGVLDVTVDQLQQTTLRRSFSGWQIPEQSQGSTPYFVRATLTNRGETDLGGRAVPLYVADSAGTLVEATSFASAFRPCRDGAFPESFPAGASAQVCLVYFVPQGTTFSSVTFRPTQEFTAIQWTGEAQQVRRGGDGGGSGGGAGAGR